MQDEVVGMSDDPTHPVRLAPIFEASRKSGLPAPSTALARGPLPRFAGEERAGRGPALAAEKFSKIVEHISATSVGTRNISRASELGGYRPGPGQDWAQDCAIEALSRT